MIDLRCAPAGAEPSEIRIGRGILPDLIRAADGRRAFAVIDAAVADREALQGAAWTRHVVTGGEQQKTFAGCEQILRAMVRAELDRGSLLVAIGGGALGDLAGLCASLFLRGIELWQVPTTLLAMVDSCVGGKTALNLPEGKNLVGSVHPARRVAIDLDFVGSLPDREAASGLAEAIKMAIGLDRELFELLERSRERVLARDPELLAAVVHRSVAAKIGVVEGDLHEHGRRRLLNLGHTLGHALEAHSGWRLPHGLCVARGLHFAIDLALELGAMAAADHRRCRQLLDAYGHARGPLPPTAALMPFLARDKKVHGAAVHFALPTAVGASEVRAIGLAQIAAAIDRG